MHTSVLLKESIDGLDLKAGDVFVDGTLGSGGHSAEVCRRFGKAVTLVGFDRDEDAIARAKKVITDAGCSATYIVGNFGDFNQALDTAQIAAVDKILLDLGISSNQLDEAGRGFTFKGSEPLLMTMKKNPSEDDLTAREIVNTWEEENLADIIYGYGEERYSRRIARAIVAARKEKPIETTEDLVAVIGPSVPAGYRKGKIHFATRTFQALRIAVNDELGSLSAILTQGFERLAPGGRMAVISFHSLEDRIVKRFFREKYDAGNALLITKKPIVPAPEEVRTNPRSRSAKLRILEKK